MNEGTIASMKTLGITESYKLKRQVVLSASEAAEMIIRCEFNSSLSYQTSLTLWYTGWTTSFGRHRVDARRYDSSGWSVCSRHKPIIAVDYDLLYVFQLAQLN
jgi:hypothetical protein